MIIHDDRPLRTESNATLHFLFEPTVTPALLNSDGSAPDPRAPGKCSFHRPPSALACGQWGGHANYHSQRDRRGGRYLRRLPPGPRACSWSRRAAGREGKKPFLERASVTDRTARHSRPRLENYGERVCEKSTCSVKSRGLGANNVQTDAFRGDGGRAGGFASCRSTFLDLAECDSAHRYSSGKSNRMRKPKPKTFEITQLFKMPYEDPDALLHF
ncbi:uncharacterized protein [Callorhinus ursinus]|uniref:uncharacterized protein n=1 Tax=Callorhinus ursinus TaxID=34884 RepID=UPI003CD04F01